MSKKKKPHFHCKTEAQKKAIKRSYAKKAEQKRNYFSEYSDDELHSFSLLSE